MRKVILFIATSLDGFIAAENHALSFLSVVEKKGEDYGYNDFVQTIDTVIMGRKTYDKVLTFGGDFPHKDKKCFVLSKSKSGRDNHVEFYNGDILELIALLRKKAGKDIFIDGGAEIVFELMKENLIDKLIISIIPYLLGSGISLFRPGRAEQKIILTDAKVFPSGLVQLHYELVH